MNAMAAETFLETTQTLALYKDMVYGIALTHTKSKTDAEDVFQEVFLVYHRKQPSFATSERRKAWLIVTTLNCAKQITSSSWQNKVVLLHAELEDQLPDNQFRFRTDEQNMVFAALQELPIKYRTVLHLFYFEDLPITQISGLLGIEEGTVKVQLSRGRAMMRDRLKGEYFND